MSLRGVALAAATALAAFAVCLGAAELGLRALVRPSERSWGTLFGTELPPLRLVVPDAFAERSRGEWYEQLVVDGRRITIGDLWGYYRSDDLLGYAPQENRISAAGWWQTNELGARARRSLSRELPPGQRRVLVFGESFAQGSRVPQEEAWPNLLDAADDGLEVVNFGVDGYSMAQAHLRYRSLREVLEHDTVVLMFAPREDLWRDVNVFRDLAEPGWNTPPQPRFVLERDGLRLVRFDAGSGGDGAAERERVRRHLERYDRLYCAPHEDARFGGSVVAKLAVVAFCRSELRRTFRGMLRPESEAMRVSTAIFGAMDADARAADARFVLVVVPTSEDVEALARRGGFVQRWQALVAAACGAVRDCVDLADGLVREAERLDHGYDGTHYGPVGNRIIASLVEPHLRERPAAE